MQAAEPGKTNLPECDIIRSMKIETYTLTAEEFSRARAACADRTDAPQLLFLDIETTGLARGRDRIYLIGLMEMTRDRAVLTQWLSQSPSDEPVLLRAFSEALHRTDPDETLLLTFNGDTFDLPFLTERAGIYGIPLAWDGLPHEDLYRTTRRMKRLLGLPDCRQKTLERFLGIGRDDECSGGELISVCRDYERTRSAHAEHLLLLHNREDVLDMPLLLPVLAYDRIAAANVRVTDVSLETYRTIRGEEKQELFLLAQADLSLPRPVQLREPTLTLNWQADRIRVRLPLEEGEARRYYADWRNYYYLPEEDTCVHRSVGSFVDPMYRQKATRDRCYARVSGRFYPAGEALLAARSRKKKPEHLTAAGTPEQPVFYPCACPDRPCLELTARHLEEPSVWNDYLTGCLRMLAER